MDIPDEIPPPEKLKDFGEQGTFNVWMKYAVIVAVLVCAVGVSVCFLVEWHGKKPSVVKDAETEDTTQEAESQQPTPDLHNPVRPAPATFPVDSNLPRGPERFASGPIDLATFNPGKDLTRFEDKRVWFESDNKPNAQEDDHIIHRAMEVPLKRLVNLLEKKDAKAKLKVQDAYRPTGIHLQNSLHREGRAIDLTSEKVSLSELAKLAWQAGFDFVLYEKPGAGGGEHLHCSVKRSPDAPLPERPKN